MPALIKKDAAFWGTYTQPKKFKKPGTDLDFFDCNVPGCTSTGPEKHLLWDNLSRHLTTHGKPKRVVNNPQPKVPCNFCGRFFAKGALLRHQWPPEGSNLKHCPQRTGTRVRKRNPGLFRRSDDVNDPFTPIAAVSSIPGPDTNGTAEQGPSTPHLEAETPTPEPLHTSSDDEVHKPVTPTIAVPSMPGPDVKGPISVPCSLEWVEATHLGLNGLESSGNPSSFHGNGLQFPGSEAPEQVFLAPPFSERLWKENSPPYFPGPPVPMQVNDILGPGTMCYDGWREKSVEYSSEDEDEDSLRRKTKKKKTA